MKKFTILIAILLNACGSNPKTPDDFIAAHLTNVKEYHAKASLGLIPNQIDLISQYENASQKSKPFFDANPKILPEYKAYLISEIANADSPYLIFLANKNVLKIEKIGVLSSAEISELKTLLDSTAAQRNLSDQIRFMHSDSFEIFPSLSRKEQVDKITNRTILFLQENKLNRPQLGNLITYLEKLGPNSAEAQKVKYLLPSMNIRKSEIQIIQKLYPEFAKLRADQLTAKIFLQTDGMDRLASDDLKAAIRNKYSSLDFVESTSDAHATVKIEKARHDEKVMQDKVETITYAYHQVDVLKAVLFMPNNASYMYDIVTSGNELEYGYVITAISKGDKFEKVARGKLGGEAKRCQNMRIQNVFGGVSAATFVANDHMANMCRRETVYSMSELRGKVAETVAESLSAVPIIKQSIDNY